jgi:hypothetical protein
VAVYGLNNGVGNSLNDRRFNLYDNGNGLASAGSTALYHHHGTSGVDSAASCCSAIGGGGGGPRAAFLTTSVTPVSKTTDFRVGRSVASIVACILSRRAAGIGGTGMVHAERSAHRGVGDVGGLDCAD